MNKETGDAYPEMNNILELCKIFNCQINDLVHKDMSDIDSLGEEIKMKVAKLQEEKQKKVKGISKAIYIISKIGKIGCRIGIGCMLFALLIVPAIMSNIEIKNDNQLIIFGQKINYERDDSKIHFMLPDVKDEDAVVDDKDEVKALNYIFDKIEDDRANVIIGIETVLVLASIGAYLVSVSLGHLEKLFKNIHDGDTPFTLDNVSHIKKLTYYLIASYVVSICSTGVVELFFNTEYSSSFNALSVVLVLSLFCISYIFEYGYEIQKDSKGVMYSEK